jgi:hypothetical protein
MRPVLLIALAGCNQLFGLDETVLITADAAIDAPGCAGSPFGNPQQVLGTVLDNDFDPSESSAGRELWFVRNPNTMTDFDIWIATRGSATGAFDAGASFQYNSAMNDGDPSLSGDGLIVVFFSSRGGTRLAYESKRTTIDGPLSQPVPLPASPADGIDLSFDGLTLYYIDDNGALVAIRRPARDQPFGMPGSSLAAAVRYPSLSPDELELYFTKPMRGEIYRRTRATTTAAFDPASETTILLDGGDPDVSPDSLRLHYSVSGDIHVMTRTCN